LIKELVGDKVSQDTSILDIKNCPFYQEMIFTPTPIGGKVESAKTIKDCANKRSLLILLEEVYPRLLGVQKSNEEMRNSYDNSSQAMMKFVDHIKDINEQRIIETKEVHAIEGEIN
jgi:hypothetical protein